MFGVTDGSGARFAVPLFLFFVSREGIYNRVSIYNAVNIYNVVRSAKEREEKASIKKKGDSQEKLLKSLFSSYFTTIF